MDSNIHRAQAARALGRQEPGSPAAPGAVPAFSHKTNWPDEKARFLLALALGGRRGLVASGGRAVLWAGGAASAPKLLGWPAGKEEGVESCPLTSRTADKEPPRGLFRAGEGIPREAKEPEGGAGMANGRIRGLAGTRGPLAQLLRQGAAQPSLENLQGWSPTALGGGGLLCGSTAQWLSPSPPPQTGRPTPRGLRLGPFSRSLQPPPLHTLETSSGLISDP